MTIPYNKNITKQLNSYFYVTITLQSLLQRTKQALNNGFPSKRPNDNVANKVWLINIDISNTIRLIIFFFLTTSCGGGF